MTESELTAPGRADPNHVAIERAGIDDAHRSWLGEVAGQVDARLDAVGAEWRVIPDPDVARAAAFGLLLALLAAHYTATREVLSQVAEAHPSYGTFPATRRLATLERICGSPALVAEWIGPLLGVEDPARLRPLRTFGDGDAIDDEAPS